MSNSTSPTEEVDGEFYRNQILHDTQRVTTMDKPHIQVFAAVSDASDYLPVPPERETSSPLLPSSIKGSIPYIRVS